ncbi:zinc finger BED domain-containing protein 5-like [Styela clava]|uniref:zinc finger BED domain-containing protein 5-like n=1 Tax=Styela clava TaxID=7725 RepID=UPI00193A303F|nr:zinc finger BED domain-containing protein 5-like [Styela clava]
MAIYRFDAIKPILIEHLENLITEFDRYIPDRNLTCQLWVRNSFLAKVDDLSEDIAGLQEEFIDLHHDQFHRQLLSTASLGKFWTLVKKEKPMIGSEAMTFLLPFATTYLCEQGFSALAAIKTKARNRLDPGDDMRIALSKIEPCIEDILEERSQFHQLH